MRHAYQFVLSINNPVRIKYSNTSWMSSAHNSKKTNDNIFLYRVFYIISLRIKNIPLHPASKENYSNLLS